jgi:hypothetical protein
MFKRSIWEIAAEDHCGLEPMGKSSTTSLPLFFERKQKHRLPKILANLYHPFYRGETMRPKTTLILLLTLSIALLAQTKKPTKAADKKTDGPTAVTGKPITTPSGLEYWDIKKGTGKLAEKGKKVSVHYTGWLTDGKEFDSSRDAGEPIQFDLGTGQVIKGWDEGIAGMKVRGKRQLRIPPALGYGPRGFGSSIPPNATLVFDVELMDVK